MYYNQYEDFIAGKNVVVPFYGDTALTQTAPVGPGGAQVPLSIVALSAGDYVLLQRIPIPLQILVLMEHPWSEYTKLFEGYRLRSKLHLCKV